MPDLVVVNKTEEWVSRPEKTYKVRYTVCNNGSADANASHTAIVIDGEKVNEDGFPALAAGKCYYNNTVGPFTMSGDNDTIEVCADNRDEVEESDETNNCAVNVLPLHIMPDLVIENKREQWRINESNDTYVVWYTIRNIGTANASKGHNTSLFVDGVLIESKEVPVELVPLQNYTENFTSILTLSGQSDEITVQADGNNAIDESNETNNNRTNVWSPLPAHTISLNASPKTIEANGIAQSTITANVTDELGNGVNGAQVNFSTTLGTIPSFALTNMSGIATTNLTSSTSAGTAVINGTVNDTCIEDTVRVVFGKFAVAKTNETFINVTIIVGEANVSGTNVTIRAGNITINTTEENATIIARNATEGSMIPIDITNGTLEVTLSADATYENKTVTGTLYKTKYTHGIVYNIQIYGWHCYNRPRCEVYRKLYASKLDT
jgi:hypothetical protein